MSMTAYLAVFSSGLLAGMIILVIARKMSSGDSLDLLGALRRFLLKLNIAVKSEPEPDERHGENSALPLKEVDPREQNGTAGGSGRTTEPG